jgi:gluconolactonase
MADAERNAMKTTMIVLALFCATQAFAQGGRQGGGRGGRQGAPPPPATDTTVTTAIPGVVAAGTRVTVIKEGFQGTEGPITLPDGSLIFTETGASRITKIDKDNNVTTFLENTNGSNALAFDAKGRLYSVQTTPGSTRVGIIYPKGSEATLTEGFEGRPNDLTLAKNGGIYFTVPGGNNALVYYISPDGKRSVAVEGVENPNGLTLSRDEKTLYINNTRGEYILAFEVQPNGTLTNKRNFGKYEGVRKTETGVTSGADGLAIDNEGRLYAATAAGVQVFSPQGQHLGTIPVSRPPQNIAFAGPDKKTLYIVGRGAAYKVQMLTSGFTGRAK